MLLVFPFCSKDREQAGRLMQWIEELGSYPTHSLLLVREQRAAPILVGEGDSQRFKKVQEIIVRDPDNKWPSSPSLMFRSAAKQIQYTTNEPFFWCEPDCVPMREGWLDDLAVEYDAALKSGKYFLGDIIDHRNAGPNFVPHISGVSVYPKNLIQHAGEIFYAYDDVPFDIAAGPAIHSQAKQSELIMHVWNQQGQGLAPFTSWADVEAKIFARRPKCALFHADKTGTLIPLLRERKNFSGGRMMDLDASKTADDGPMATVAENNLPAPVLAAVWPQPDCNYKVTACAEPTSEPESSAELVYEMPAHCLSHGTDFVKECPRCRYLMQQNSAETSWQTADRTPTCSWHDQTPWGNKESSLIEIRRIATRLRQFQTAPMTTHTVRSLLAEAGVIAPVRKKRRRKKK